MKKKHKSGTNTVKTAKTTGKSKQGTGKMSFQIFSPHKKNASIDAPKRSKGPLDNRGPEQRAANYKKAKPGSRHGRYA